MGKRKRKQNNRHAGAHKSKVRGAVNNDKMNKDYIDQEAETDNTAAPQNNQDAEQPTQTEEAVAEEKTPQQQLEEAQEALEKEKKEYLFLMAEFDNFRRRTLKEKAELIKNAGEKTLKGLLPVLDDFERALKVAAEAPTTDSSMLEGVELIYAKFKKYLDDNGVKEIETSPDTDFDTELHEAISVIPIPDEKLKGKILDTVQKGYTINDKVLRHAKVVVGQ